jgi:hypothetical protein
MKIGMFHDDLSPISVISIDKIVSNLNYLGKLESYSIVEYQYYLNRFHVNCNEITTEMTSRLRQISRSWLFQSGCIPVLQVCPHPPAPSPILGEGGQNSKSLSRLGRGI